MGAISIGLLRGSGTARLDGSNLHAGSALWFVFYIIAMDYPLTHLTTVQPSVRVARSEESREFAYAEGEP